MGEVLYRKYRPKNFDEVLGQDIVKTIVRNAVAAGRVSHAYLFTGPRGVGKTTMARLLAKAVNCENPTDGDPDNQCQNCKLIQEGRFLDLIEIDAASYTGVDNVREIIDHVRFSPSMGKYKVFIIDEVHMLSKAAFNALLKTLEEPPAHVIFILATTDIQKVPPTIISRSQQFDFKRVSLADTSRLLKKILLDLGISMPEEAIVLVAQAADGSFRDALSILDQLISFTDGEITLAIAEEILGITRIAAGQKFLDMLIQNQTSDAVKFIKDLVFEGKDISQFLRNFLEYLRLVLLVKLDAQRLSDMGLTEEERAHLLSQAQGRGGKN